MSLVVLIRVKRRCAWEVWVNLNQPDEEPPPSINNYLATAATVRTTSHTRVPPPTLGWVAAPESEREVWMGLRCEREVYSFSLYLSDHSGVLVVGALTIAAGWNGRCKRETSRTHKHTTRTTPQMGLRLTLTFLVITSATIAGFL